MKQIILVLIQIQLHLCIFGQVALNRNLINKVCKRMEKEPLGNFDIIHYPRIIIIKEHSHTIRL